MTQNRGVKAKGAAGAAATGTGAQRPPNHVIVRWRGDEEFEGGRPDGPTLRVDGHGKVAQSPVDALLTALASCSSIDVVGILAKRRTPVRSLEVDVVGERANDQVPRKLIRLVLTYRIAGAGIEREHAERAIELALNKYCSVRDSLDPKIPIEWKLELDPR
ncbi:MAG TPA: OsmC family protein [Gemmatimonadaceae bacterium]|nr:OsmC family protein [Gemmatimonadaceae bacterium]